MWNQTLCVDRGREISMVQRGRQWSLGNDCRKAESEGEPSNRENDIVETGGCRLRGDTRR